MNAKEFGEAFAARLKGHAIFGAVDAGILQEVGERSFALRSLLQDQVRSGVVAITPELTQTSRQINDAADNVCMQLFAPHAQQGSLSEEEKRKLFAQTQAALYKEAMLEWQNSFPSSRAITESLAPTLNGRHQS